MPNQFHKLNCSCYVAETDTPAGHIEINFYDGDQEFELRQVADADDYDLFIDGEDVEMDLITIHATRIPDLIDRLSSAHKLWLELKDSGND